MKDRTDEFFSAVDAMLQRVPSSTPYTLNGGASSLYTQEKSRLLASSSLSSGSESPSSSKSEFAKAASSIARDINGTMHKLHKLTQLAKKKTLFDDQPVEINELISIIKQVGVFFFFFLNLEL